ncbi:MAG: hypothetical protein ACXADC_10875 [Candidatus Thorarchaeota archaeon]
MSNESAAEEEYSIHWISDVIDNVLERDVDEYIVSTCKASGVFYEFPQHVY